MFGTNSMEKILRVRKDRILSFFFKVTIGRRQCWAMSPTRFHTRVTTRCREEHQRRVNRNRGSEFPDSCYSQAYGAEPTNTFHYKGWGFGLVKKKLGVNMETRKMYMFKRIYYYTFWQTKKMFLLHSNECFTNYIEMMVDLCQIG